jgi:hypothetical protein
VLKELLDNSLDAYETVESPLGDGPDITVRVSQRLLSVRDNGPGIAAEVVEGAADFGIRLSTKSHWVIPTRGRLGNALKCVFAAPLVIDEGQGDHRGWVEIEARETRWRVGAAPSALDDGWTPTVERARSRVKAGTSLTIYWPTGQAAPFERIGFAEAQEVIRAFALCNPHLTIRFNWEGDSPRTEQFTRTAAIGQCDRLDGRTSPHWYDVAELSNLIRGLVEQALRQRVAAPTVQQFVGMFAGLTGSKKPTAVAKAAGLAGTSLDDLANAKDVAALLEAMKGEARPVAPSALGAVGKLHLWRTFTNADSRRYKKVEGVANGIPFVVEAACALPDNAARTVVVGLNWTPLPGLPLKAVHEAMDVAMIDREDEVQLFVHIICPKAGRWADHGKTRMDLGGAELERAVRETIASVTTGWRKHKSKMARSEKMVGRERERVMRESRLGQKARMMTLTQEVIHDAYHEASANGRLPANARQVMYSARRRVLAAMAEERLGCSIWKDKSFTTKILPQYIADHPEETKGWDVVFDPRGNLIEPHTSRAPVPLGTVKVREYAHQWTDGVPTVDDPFCLPRVFPTCGPRYRYGAILFLEKEGFHQIVQASGILNRYDVALMSSKGMPTTSSRDLVERAAAAGVKILALHDFDRSGFSITHTLGHNTRRYQFKTKRPQVDDIGLRLKDVRRLNLESEEVKYSKQKRDPAERLRECDATEEECAYLVEEQTSDSTWVGQRVELNAMDSATFVAFLEDKFKEFKVRKVVPTPADLAEAHLTLARWTEAKRRADEALRQPDLRVPAAPSDLHKRVSSLLEGNPSWSWDMALAHLVSEACKRQQRQRSNGRAV